jgi:hypothetical protein
MPYCGHRQHIGAADPRDFDIADHRYPWPFSSGHQPDTLAGSRLLGDFSLDFQGVHRLDFDQHRKRILSTSFLLIQRIGVGVGQGKSHEKARISSARIWIFFSFSFLKIPSSRPMTGSP